MASRSTAPATRPAARPGEPAARLAVDVHLRPDQGSTLSRDVLEGLSRAPYRLPPKHFYDDEGSRLFDAICDTPEYYLTRAEAALLARAAPAIIAASGAAELVELLDALRDRVAGPVGTRTPVVVSHEQAGQLPARPAVPATTPVVLAVEAPPGFDAADLVALMEIAASRARALLSGTLEG